MSRSVFLFIQKKAMQYRQIYRRKVAVVHHILACRHFRLNPNPNMVTDGPEVRNFSELTLQWIINSTDSHMQTNEDSYGFGKNDIKLLSDDGSCAYTLITCSAQNTSQWFINRMLSHKHFVHSFTNSADFQPLKNLFKISADAVPKVNDGIMTLDDKSSNIRIEQTEVNEIDKEWMQHRGYNGYFDVIFDELAVDNIVFDDYVQTTIYGHCLKKGGVIYVSDKRITGDIAGRKLRSKMNELYPNSHFELVAERDAAWVTQFIYLKALNCSEQNVDRESHRKDHWGDSHLDYNQSAIWERSKVTENAGMGMTEGMERVAEALKRENPGN